MKNQIKDGKAITLIALVITIIVLLILAGVTIVTLTGNNGLITKANDSQILKEIGEEKEKISLGYNEYKIDKYTNTNPTLKVQDATVTGNETSGWTITFSKTNHQYTLSKDGIITGPTNSQTAQFDATEWDKTASSDEWFIWDENDSSIITGFNLNKLSEVEGTINLRIPSKCKEINGNNLMRISNELEEKTEEEARSQVMSILSNYQKITSAELPGNIKTVGDYAFAECSGLSNIIIPNSVTTIGEFAFGDCESLNNVTFGSGLQNFGSGIFENCSALSSFTFDSKLPENFFQNLTSVENVTIGNNVTAIDERNVCWMYRIKQRDNRK